jgi:exosortase
MSEEQQQPPKTSPQSPQSTQSTPEIRPPRDRLVTVAIVIALAFLLASIYAPLLYWLGRTTLHLDQLHNGGLIVLFALVIGLRRIIRKKRLEVDVSRLGLVLVIAGLACLLLVRWAPGFALIFALVSFCLSFAGVSAFLFGPDGVKNLLPAIVGVLLLGILAGLAPGLDWPMRGLAAKYSGVVLQQLGMNVNLEIEQGLPPRLLLGLKDRVFVVASECNGFGLLTSSIVIAAVLGFYYELTWPQKMGLLLLSVPLAIVFNALRIVGISLSAVYTPLPYMLIHEGLGLVFYVAALMLLWWLARRRSRKSETQRMSGG